MRLSLDGRVVLITGTAGGQGAAAAELFRGAGASYVTGANLVVDGGWSAVLPGAAVASNSSVQPTATGLEDPDSGLDTELLVLAGPNARVGQSPSNGRS